MILNYKWASQNSVKFKDESIKFEELSLLEQHIYNSCKKGNKLCQINEKNFDVTIEDLNKNGFKHLMVGEFIDEGWLEISWKH